MRMPQVETAHASVETSAQDPSDGDKAQASGGDSAQASSDQHQEPQMETPNASNGDAAYLRWRHARHTSGGDMREKKRQIGQQGLTDIIGQQGLANIIGQQGLANIIGQQGLAIGGMTYTRHYPGSLHRATSGYGGQLCYSKWLRESGQVINNMK